MAAPQKKSVVPAPVKKKTLNRAPLWLASHKKKKKVVESPIKSPPPQREWSPIAGRYIRLRSRPSRSSGRLRLW